MRIGELARRTGCGADTIRYYEREGLLPRPGRSGANYRLYEASHLTRLTFIRNCRALEMSLEEIRALLAIMDGDGNGGGSDCDEVSAVIRRHIGHVEDRLARLTALQEQLERLLCRCGGAQPAGHCGILRELTAVQAGAAGGDAAGDGCLDGIHGLGDVSD